MAKKVHVVVAGKVQGVFYRASLRSKAQSLGLEGFVRNLADGSVEYVAHGPQERVDELVAWSRTGTPLSRVMSLHISDIDDDELFAGFEVRH